MLNLELSNYHDLFLLDKKKLEYMPLWKDLLKNK